VRQLALHIAVIFAVMTGADLLFNEGAGTMAVNKEVLQFAKVARDYVARLVD
jgi:hypothetical protein